MQIRLRTGVNIRLCFQIDIKYSQILFCPKSSSRRGEVGREWVCSRHLRCASPAKPQAREAAPLPAEMSDAQRRWRCLWELWLPLTPIFCLRSHKKTLLATKQGAGSSPPRPSLPTYHLCTVTGMQAGF